jgi:hypothetical protein
MQKRLLTFSALCVAGTVGGALLSSTALFPALIAGATGVASNIWATDLFDFGQIKITHLLIPSE